jgi:N utilization substance protein B
MPLVDRNILRLAVFEILYRDDVPDSVSINEAVEMAKVYGGEDSSKFVNGILGRLADVSAAGGFEEGPDD